MNEDFLRNAELVGRDQESLWTPRLSLSKFILLDPRSAVLPELVNSRGTVVIMMPLICTLKHLLISINEAFWGDHSFAYSITLHPVE